MGSYKQVFVDVLNRHWLVLLLFVCFASCHARTQPGINFIDAQPRDRLGELAFSYIREEGAVKELAGVVEGSDDR